MWHNENFVCMFVGLSSFIRWFELLEYRDSVSIDPEFIYVSGSHNKKIYQVRIRWTDRQSNIVAIPLLKCNSHCTRTPLARRRTVRNATQLLFT